VGAVNLALIARQEQREAAVRAQKAEAREKRRARRLSKSASKTSVQDVSKTPVQEPSRVPVQAAPVDTRSTVQNVQNGVQDAALVSSLDTVNLSRQERKAQLLDTLLDIYRDNPGAGATDISRRLDIGRSTVYHYLDELEAAGKVRKNGHGVEVLAL